MIEDQEPLDALTAKVEKVKKSYISVDAFSAVLVAVVVIALWLSIYLYRLSFGGELSVSPDKWSAFGTYIGGLFGPLISFLTLLAILKTIGLQKELLDTQRYEFEAMQRLQAKTLDSQLAQIKRANAEADRRVIEETRLNILKTLDNNSSALQAEYEAKQRGLEMLLQRAMDGKTGPTLDQVHGMRDTLKVYGGRLAAMAMLHSDLCFDDFEDVASLRSYYQSEMEKIWSEWKLKTGSDISPPAD